MITTSVIISTYNGEKTIYNQLYSIYSQTMTVDEVLIFDDCSFDNTYTIASEFVNSHTLDNWRVIKNKENLGWQNNFANAILRASKDVIFLCDQDDIWYDNKVEIMCKMLEKHKDISMLVSDVKPVYVDKGAIKVKHVFLSFLKYKRLRFHPYTINIRRPGSTFAIRRDLANKCIRDFWLQDIAHDRALWTYALLYDQMGYIKEKTMDYCRYKTNVSYHKKSISVRLLGIENDLKISDQSLLQKGLSEKKVHYIKKYKEFSEKRRRALGDRSIVQALFLIRYMFYYKRLFEYLGDVWLTIKNGE